MHLIIPFASSLSAGCLAAQQSLRLPHLQQLLKRLTPLPPSHGDAFSLSTPHECVLASALGLPLADGQIPWAALHAHSRSELPAAEAAWAFVTLCHWQVNTHHVAMSHLPLPDLAAVESDALLDAMRGYFEDDGITLHADQPGRWLAQAPVFAEIASASIDRVVGRNLANWLPASKAAAPLRRLQSEMQMLLYTHPVNDGRAARGLPPVNSFWFSGSGALPSGYQRPLANDQPVVSDSLRQPALTENWPAWTQAWQALDVSHLQPLLHALRQGQPVQLTLCGERSSQSWTAQSLGIWQKISGLFASQPISSKLEKL